VAKKVKAIVRIQIAAGKATPAPPVGTALGPHGVNIMAFCKDYNERTAKDVGSIIPAEITIYEDRTLTFVTKTPPTADMLRKALGVEKGSGKAGETKVGTLSKDKIREIAKVKLKDLNTEDIEAAEKTVVGTASSMGIEVE
jgi:large subunit ribosomal protein L11